MITNFHHVLSHGGALLPCVFSADTVKDTAGDFWFIETLAAVIKLKQPLIVLCLFARFEFETHKLWPVTERAHWDRNSSLLQPRCLTHMLNLAAKRL